MRLPAVFATLSLLCAAQSCVSLAEADAFVGQAALQQQQQQQQQLPSTASETTAAPASSSSDSLLYARPEPFSTLVAIAPRKTDDAAAAAAIIDGDTSYSDSVAAPAITEAPTSSDSIGDLEINIVQTTYYSCVTIGTYSHCGWHEPVIDTRTSSASKPPSLHLGLWAAWTVFVAVFMGVAALGR